MKKIKDKSKLLRANAKRRRKKHNRECAFQCAPKAVEPIRGHFNPLIAGSAMSLALGLSAYQFHRKR